MEDDAINEVEQKSMQARLIAIRKWKARDNQAEFARLLDISPTRWNNIERGFPLTLKLAFLITKRVGQGVTISYIAEGDSSRMSKAAREQILAYEAAVRDELFPSSKSKRSKR